MTVPTPLSKVLLLSIRPRYTELILSGKKTIELRKRRPNVPPGTLVVMYASQPVCAIVGTFVLGGIVSDRPAALWTNHGAQAGISKDLFEQYYERHECAFGLLIQDVRSLENEVGLAALRKCWDGFHPPQSYRYLRPARTSQSLRLQFSNETTHLSL
jgi:predicted transcriptional regulator